MITLLTDFGTKDEYAGVMKGVILSLHPSARIVDLSHQVPPGDTLQAAWLLAWSWSWFPKGTVHVVVVDPGVGSSRKVLCAEHRGHLFLGPDNGVLSRALEDKRPPSVRWVKNRRYFLRPASRTFHGRDIFAPVAARLAQGLDPKELGPRIASWKRFPKVRVRSGPGRLAGQVIQRDHFGNAVTNISTEDLARGPKRPGRVEIWARGVRVGPLRRSYSEAGKGGPLAIIGSRGLLEIAVREGSAANDLALSVGDRVEVVRGKR